MSAWIVSKGHVDCLVQSLAMEGIISFNEADAVGQDLWRENHRSINYRYDERRRTPKYAFEGVEAPLDPAVVLKQVVCYDYQSCERPDWKRSRASKRITQLQEVLLARLGHSEESQFYDNPRWHSAPWGIESITEAIAHPDREEVTA